MEHIKQLARQWAPELIQIREHLHAHPELSFQEHHTSTFLQKKLKEWGISFEAPVAGTGIVALIGKKESGPVVALRADMDALPIEEENEVPYKSQNPGIMHACGHDVHMSCVLGAVRILKTLEPQLPGTIKVLFQPGEEKHPGGASLMIREGVLEHPKPQAIIGLHVQPDLPAGTLGFHSGIAMASADEIYITVRGPGGHAAAPHLTTDTILVASHLVVGLQQVISRNRDPFASSVLSICAFNGGHTTNVIPAEVQLKGTFRAMDEVWRFKAHELIRKQAMAIAEGMGASCEVNILVGYPCLINDEATTLNMMKWAEHYLGQDNVLEVPQRMGAEDFAFYSQRVPACFFRLGVGNIGKGISAGVHTSRFDIDSRAIEIGMGSMAWMAWNLIQP